MCIRCCSTYTYRVHVYQVLQHPFCAAAMGEVMAREEAEARPLGEVSEAALAQLDIDDDDEE